MMEVLTMVMSGGEGTGLYPLTRDRAKPAVVYGGKYRLIDFPLSNCRNSGLRHILVLTQYKSDSLNRHLAYAWNFLAKEFDEYLFGVPAQQRMGKEWYQGTADSVRQNIRWVEEANSDYVLILAGDHVYKMNYQLMLNYHKEMGAKLTISAIEVPVEDAKRLGVMEIDEHGRIVGFEEKPESPKPIPDNPEHALASMGVYIFDRQTLIDALHEYETEHDFGRQIIPRMVEGGDIFAYDYTQRNSIGDYVYSIENGRRIRRLEERIRDSSYWRDVGTLDAYWEANMDLVGVDPLFNLYGELWPIHTYQTPKPPTKSVFDETRAINSLVSDGCIISGGEVRYSVLSPDVIVERNAVVEHSLLFHGVVVESGARIRRAIIDKGVTVPAGMSIGHNLDEDRKRFNPDLDNGLVTDSGIVAIARKTKL